MARIIDDQVNPWGRQQGIDPQRTDLWTVDFTNALSGLVGVAFDGVVMPGSPNIVPFLPPKLATYYVNSVSLPSLVVKSDPIRRDSRPYQTPSWDDPPESVKIVFILDCFRPGKNFDPYRSDIYQMLDIWRAVVRAGRGGLSGEYAITLDAHYRIDYAFDVALDFLRATVPQLAVSGEGIANDLAYSMRYTLVNCWLGSFRGTELTYEGARVFQIEANFYIEDLLQSQPKQTH